MADELHVIFGTGPVGMATMEELVGACYEFEEPFISDGRALQSTFGFQPTALRPALEATIDWYRAASTGRSLATFPYFSGPLWIDPDSQPIAKIRTIRPSRITKVTRFSE